MIIYLGGSIHAKSWDDAAAWRDEMINRLEPKHKIRNPLRNRLWQNPNEQEQFHPNELVHRDINDITDCDALLVEYADPEANYCGTSMEMWEANRQGKFIIAMVGDRETWSPWLDFVATVIVRTWDEAERYINDVLNHGDVDER